MSFQIKLLKLTPPQHPDQSGAVIQLSLANAVNRPACVVAYEFELWHIVNRNTNGSLNLSALRPDLNKEFPGKFEPNQQMIAFFETNPSFSSLCT
jgi:hypothetical protein